MQAKAEHRSVGSHVAGGFQGLRLSSVHRACRTCLATMPLTSPLLLLCMLVVSCHCCTEVILNDSRCNDGPVVSSRTMSFGAELGPRVSAAPAKSRLRLLPVAAGFPSTFGATIDIQHGFVCISHLPSTLQQQFPPNDPIAQQDHVFCVDGMNAKGLSAAILYQGETKVLPTYNAHSTKAAAINLIDLPAFLLARYATVAEVQLDLEDTVQVVWCPTYNALGRMISAGGQDAPPLHLTVHDGTGASLVIQFREGKMEVLRNPLGVFTNQPLLQEQSQNYNDWMTAHNYTADTQPQGGQWIMPGDYSSQSRFIRLAMVKTATSRECWPTTVMEEKQRLSPGSVPPGYPPTSPALLAVIGIQQSVYLPRGITDDGTADVPVLEEETTPYSTLRDHSSAIYYYRTGNSLLYRSIAVKALSSHSTGRGLVHTPLLPPRQPWVIDETQSLIRAAQSTAQY